MPDFQAPEGDQQKEQRRQHVASLFSAIDDARKFDADARKQYARDRRYARGDTGFAVDSNIVGTFIEILTSFLYSRDPDVAVLPARASEPPPLSAFVDAMGKQGLPPDLAQIEAEAQHKAMLKAYQSRKRDGKALSESLEIIISRLWSDAGLKRQARRWVRSCLTVGVGWGKAAWQTRTESDPLMRRQASDIQDNIARLAAMRATLDDPSACATIDAQREQYEQALAGLQSNMERVIARGFAVDMVPAEDIQVAIDVACLSEYLNAPWISHRSFMRVTQAQAEFGLSDEALRKAVRYGQRKPTITKDVSPAIADDVSAEEADAYTSGAGQGEQGKSMGECVRIEEVWSREDGRVYTLIEGLDGYAKEPWSPRPTTRFYPFFLFATSETDGQRHPQSLTSRSYRLIDEYARVRSSYAEHRRRTRPKTAFNASLLSEEDARKLEGATEQEMVPLRLTDPTAPVSAVIQPITYAALDPSLYETHSIMSELERIWGVQEALSQAIATPKTATEAEIQQTGFHARTGAMRDAMEDTLRELAIYTAEVALVNMARSDAQHLAGEQAFWPEGVTAEELAMLASVQIRAGSSGRPNTSAEREAWASLLPLLQSAVQTIAQLRQSPPADVADRLEELLRETARRAGDRLDVDRLVPQAGQVPQAMPGVPAIQGQAPQLGVPQEMQPPVTDPMMEAMP